MSIRTERVLAVTCDHDGCPAQHRKPGTWTTMEARIAAGIDGWAFRRGNGNSRSPDKRPHADACPEHAQQITQENQA